MKQRRLQSGDRFSHLTIRELFQSHNHVRRATVICDCGTIKQVYTYHLVRKRKPIQSCGCIKNRLSGERLKNQARIHGLTGIPEHRVWSGMKTRCLNPKRRNFKWYGALGVQVCDRWANNFENFLQDMGHRPSPKHTIDRIDPSGNYEPSNCRWVTWDIQAANRRKKYV